MKTSVARATRRVRNYKAVSFLTKGADDYYHRGMNKARRALDSAIIGEQLEDGPVVESIFKGPVSFRVVISTQDHENYGAHACECPPGDPCSCVPYWKAKGGEDFQRDVGSANDVIALGPEGIRAIVGEMRSLVERDDNYYRAAVIGWSVVPSDEETPGERDLREMREWGWLTDLQHEARLAHLFI